MNVQVSGIFLFFYPLQSFYSMAVLADFLGPCGLERIAGLPVGFYLMAGITGSDMTSSAFQFRKGNSSQPLQAALLLTVPVF